ncbi:MAG TPA: hypothetical protein VHI71_11750 [Actinomycetota bacterium]|nr:hypothetical protein [Actinomycetota bacterium]
MRSFRLRALVAGLAVLGLVVAAPTASGGPPGRWTKIGNPSANFAQPGLARTADGTLHLVWVRHTPGNAAADDVVHTSIAANGTVGATGVVQSAWASAWPQPDLVLTADGGLRAFWGGIRSVQSNEQHTNISSATAPSSGSPWTLQPGDVSEGAGGSSSSIGAAVAPDGTPLFSWSPGGEGFVHRGTDPASANHEFDTPGQGCCNYDPDLATDDATGEMWVAWYSNQADAEGIWVQEVDPATGQPTGSPARMPGTVTTYNGEEKSVQEIQRTPIAAPEGGGVFVAYTGGYPSTNRVLVWKIGTSNAAVVARSGDRELNTPGLAADPSGRLWVVWSQVDAGGTPIIFARRSNVGGSRWGAVVRLRPPRALGDCKALYSVTPSAQSSVLDVVANFIDGCGAAVAFWHTQLRAGLSLTARPRTFTRRATVVFTVTDAGDPVEGARVRVDGKSATTGPDGQAEIALGPYSSARRLTARATKAGYAAASARLRVRE